MTQAGPPPYQPVPPPPPRKRRRALVITLLIVVPLLLCCGGVAVFAFVRDDDGTTAAEAPSSEATSTSAAPKPKRESDGAGKAEVGECINLYTVPAPSPTASLQPGEDPPDEEVTASERVRCAKGTHQVLKRFDETVDREVCQDVRGTDSAYYQDGSGRSDDFVLCLKKR